MIALNILEDFKKIKNHSDTSYTKLPEPINQISDHYWFVEISSKSVPYSPIFDWHKVYHGLPYELMVLAQETSLLMINGHTNPKTGRIVLSSRATLNSFYNIAHLFRLILKEHKNFEDWKKLNISNLQDILISDLDKFRKKHKNNANFKSNTGHARLERFLFILRAYRDKANNISPFSSYTLRFISSTESFCSDYLKSIKIPHAKFIKSEHHELIPFHIAMPWLAFILNEFNSEELKYWRLIWLFQRSMLQIKSYKNKTVNITNMEKALNTVNDIYNGEYFFSKGKRYIQAVKLLNEYKSQCIHIFGDYIEPQQTLTFIKDKVKKTGTSHNSKTTYTINYLRHLYAAIAITNGPRRSEIVYLKLSDFDEISDNTSSYSSFVHKTNDSLPTVRSISGFVHNMVKKSCDLGYHDKFEDDVYLFDVRNISNSKTLDIGTKSNYINDSYQLFLNSLPEELANEFRDECPAVTTHQARHLFAAFALRVSDGNVFDAIRKHFRHELGSFMTNDYTEYKLSEEEQEFVEREYISEIISRIASNEDHGFFGPMLYRIEKIIEDKMDFWGIETFEELSGETNKLADLFDTIKVHEWGLCIPEKNNITKSKCYDKNTKLPEYDKNSSFNNCSACIHLLSNDACIDDIKRIAFSISQTLDNYPLISGSLRNFYIKSLKRAEKLLQQAV